MVRIPVKAIPKRITAVIAVAEVSSPPQPPLEGLISPGSPLRGLMTNSTILPFVVELVVTRTLILVAPSFFGVPTIALSSNLKPSGRGVASSMESVPAAPVLRLIAILASSPTLNSYLFSAWISSDVRVRDYVIPQLPDIHNSSLAHVLTAYHHVYES